MPRVRVCGPSIVTPEFAVVMSVSAKPTLKDTVFPRRMSCGPERSHVNQSSIFMSGTKWPAAGGGALTKIVQISVPVSIGAPISIRKDRRIPWLL